MPQQQRARLPALIATVEVRLDDATAEPPKSSLLFNHFGIDHAWLEWGSDTYGDAAQHEAAVAASREMRARLLMSASIERHCLVAQARSSKRAVIQFRNSPIFGQSRLCDELIKQ